MNLVEDIQKNDEGSRSEKPKKKDSRLVISKEAEEIVTEYTAAVNNGFDAGKATRFDVASFMILWFKEHSSNDVVADIQRQLADGISMLDAIHKQAKSSGDLPPEVQAVLEEYFFGSAAQGQKKKKNNLKQRYSSDTPKTSEVA